MLKNVRVGPIDLPFTLGLYGVHGVGKTEFAAGAPSPLFMDLEDGTARLNVGRIEPRPRTWEEILDKLDEIIRDNDGQFKTLVIDTLDCAVKRCYEYICRAHGKTSILHFGYRNGHITAAAELEKLVAKLEEVRIRANMNIIILAHAFIQKFKSPYQDGDFNYFGLELEKETASIIPNWVEMFLFARHEHTVYRAPGAKISEIGRAVATGERVIHTKWDAAYIAKTRFKLPDTIPLNWDEFAEAMNDKKEPTAEEIIGEIREILSTITETHPGIVERTNLVISDSNNNPARLLRLKQSLIVKLGTEKM